MFEPWLTRWALVPDGEPIIAPGSRLLPVCMEDVPAMLKIAIDAEEKFGNLPEDDDALAAEGQLQVAQLVASMLDA